MYDRLYERKVRNLMGKYVTNPEKRNSKGSNNQHNKRHTSELNTLGRALIIILIILMCVTPLLAYGETANNQYNIVINNTALNTKGMKSPTGVYYIPIRDVFSKLEYDVTWDQSTKTVKISKGEINPIIVTLKPNTTTFLRSTANTAENLKDNTIVVKGISYAPIELLNRFGISYNITSKSIEIYTQFMIVTAGQDNSFIEKSLKPQDITRVASLLSTFATKNNIRYEQQSYLDSRTIEDLYDYISEKPNKVEITESAYSWGNYLNPDANRNTVTKLTRVKTLAPLAGIEMKFEPSVYYIIGGNIHLIGGYVDYGDSKLNIYDAYNNYVKNYEEVTWTLLRESTKVGVKAELIKFLNDINAKNDMVIFLLQDGNITYME